MKQLAVSTLPVNADMNRLSPNHFWELAARLLTFRADRWKRRALFYRRYREYFPHMSTSRFVERCLELDIRYRRMADLLSTMSRQGRMMTVPEMVVRRKPRRAAVLPPRPALV
ncbi:MAG: hypothetical protein OEY86_00040 [Nitrospira sp.]|nr:hypothetical protein [Nitrospira sp.]